MSDLTQAPDIHKVTKTWGYELWIANSALYCGKMLHFNAGKRCSLHYHKLKDETFYLHSGHVVVKLLGPAQDSEVRLLPGDSLHIPPGTLHQIEALADSDLYEFSTEHFDSDSYRISR